MADADIGEVQQQISDVGTQITKVESAIEAVNDEIGNVQGQIGDLELQIVQATEQQQEQLVEALSKKEEQLRKKEEQLRDRQMFLEQRAVRRLKGRKSASTTGTMCWPFSAVSSSSWLQSPRKKFSQTKMQKAGARSIVSSFLPLLDSQPLLSSSGMSEDPSSSCLQSASSSLGIDNSGDGRQEVQWKEESHDGITYSESKSVLTHRHWAKGMDRNDSSVEGVFGGEGSLRHIFCHEVEK